MKLILRHIAGYSFGGALFLFIIPFVLFEVTKLDYLLNYQSLINSMILRFAISAIFLIAGIFLIIWSNAILFFKGKGGPADIMGISISPRTKKLVTKGPYRFSRNPMVLGAFLIYLAEVCYLNSPSGFLVWIFLLVVVIRIVLMAEEKRLLKDFGEDYVEYKRKVSPIFPFPFRRQLRMILTRRT